VSKATLAQGPSGAPKRNPARADDDIARIVGAQAGTDTTRVKSENADPRTPVTLLTGWLGAGKTTLLNHLLAQPHGQRFAVLINEFGDIGIDDRLVVHAEEDLVELQNGCVCCTVRGDLVKTLRRLRKRRPPWFRRRHFDRVIIETTGIAEPAPLLRTFLLEAEMATFYVVESVVGLVDASRLDLALQNKSATEQISLADLLVLNQIDLADEEMRQSAKQTLFRLNPTAPILETKFCQVPALEVFKKRPPRRLEEIQNSAGEPPGQGHANIGTVSLRSSKALDEMKVQLWLGTCVQQLGDNLIRYKGFLYLQSRPYRAILQGTYGLFQVDAGEDWNKDEPRQTELVFIGRDLEKDFFQRGLKACEAV